MLSDESFVFHYIIEIIFNLNQIDAKEKHSRLLLMANSTIETKAICGINGLGRLKYPTDDNHELINNTLLCFDSLVKKEHYAINGDLSQLFLFSFFSNKIN
jgi:hypothetical protein